jgi:hypothetical protein
MIAGVVFIFALSTLARPLGATAVALALVATAGAAVAGNFDMNYLTMLLAHNETVYFENIVRRAIETHSTAVIIVDPRPFTLPEDHPVAYDEGGHSVPPYELSCFSGYCLQNGAIVTIIAERLGVPRGGLPVYSIRNGDPIPDANCKMLTSPTIALPAGASQSSIDTINFIRGLGPITCVSYSLAWRNIDVPP